MNTDAQIHCFTKAFADHAVPSIGYGCIKKSWNYRFTNNLAMIIVD